MSLIKCWDGVKREEITNRLSAGHLIDIDRYIDNPMM